MSFLALHIFAILGSVVPRNFSSQWFDNVARIAIYYLQYYYGWGAVRFLYILVRLSELLWNSCHVSGLTFASCTAFARVLGPRVSSLSLSGSRTPLTIKTYTTLVPTFAKKGVIFKRRREIKKKGWFFRHKSAKFWKRGNVLHVSAWFHTLDLGRVFKYSFQITHNEKHAVHRKIFDTINPAFTKGYFILYNDNKIAFCYKKERFIGPQNQRFRLKKGCFSLPKSAKGGYSSSLGTSMVYGKWLCDPSLPARWTHAIYTCYSLVNNVCTPPMR